MPDQEKNPERSLSKEEAVEVGLRDRLTTNLAAVNYSGPARVFGGEIITLLMDMLMGLLEGCFNSTGSLQGAKVKKLNSFQKSRLKRNLKSELYEGKTRTYNNLEGDKVLAALVKTIEESSESDTDELLNYVETNAREFGPPPDFGRL